MRVSATTWRALQALQRPEDGLDDPVFRSRKGGRLSTVQAWRLVREAAPRARIAAQYRRTGFGMLMPRMPWTAVLPFI